MFKNKSRPFSNTTKFHRACPVLHGTWPRCLGSGRTRSIRPVKIPKIWTGDFCWMESAQYVDQCCRLSCDQSEKSHAYEPSTLFLFPTPVRWLCWTISLRSHPFCVAEDEFCSGEYVDKLRSLRTLLSLSLKTCIPVENWFKIVSIFWCLIDPMLCTENKWNQSEWITQLCWNEFLYCLHFSGILECGNFFISISKFPTAVVSHEV